MNQVYASVAQAAIHVIKEFMDHPDFERKLDQHLKVKNLKGEIDTIIESNVQDKSQAILLAIAEKADNCLDYIEDDTTMVEDIQAWLFAEAGIPFSAES